MTHWDSGVEKSYSVEYDAENDTSNTIVYNTNALEFWEEI